MNEYPVHKSWSEQGKHIVETVNGILRTMPSHVRVYSCSFRDRKWYLFHHRLTFPEQVYLVHQMDLAGYRIRMNLDTFEVYPDDQPVSIQSMCDKCI